MHFFPKLPVTCCDPICDTKAHPNHNLTTIWQIDERDLRFDVSFAPTNVKYYNDKGI